MKFCATSCVFFATEFPQTQARLFGTSMHNWEIHEERVLGRCRALADFFADDTNNPGNAWSAFVPQPLTWAHFGNYSVLLALQAKKRLGK
jgi:hypothetical protein